MTGKKRWGCQVDKKTAEIYKQYFRENDIYFEVYNVQQDFPEVDGGMIMLTELFQNKFKSTKDAIPAVLDMAYGNESIGYIVLD